MHTNYLAFPPLLINGKQNLCWYTQGDGGAQHTESHRGICNYLLLESKGDEQEYYQRQSADH